MGNRSRSRRNYIDFEFGIEEQGIGNRYPVIVHWPQGEADGEIRFPFGERELGDKLRDLEYALLRSGGAPEEQTVQSFGQALFDALFIGETRAHYAASLDEARRQNKGLRLKLQIRPQELSALPWEFLYDTNLGYLCSSMTSLVRYTNLPGHVGPLTATPPLKILGMVASPQGLSQLDVSYEKRLMQEAMKDLQEAGLVELSWLGGDTWRDLQESMRGGDGWRDLQRAMRHGPWHVFHFVGHGGFNPATEEGAIALADDEGRQHLFGATALARLLDDHHYLRLVVLNASEDARGSESDAFSSTAATLVRQGVPAVLAMQYRISDRAAIEFYREFYAAVAHGLSVDGAVARGRRAIKIVSALEWGTPALYMSSPDGYIFDVSATEASHFQEADRRYAEIKRRHEAGTLTDEEFDEQLKQLMVQDQEGRWWVKSRKTGDWHYYDGTTWIKDTPPGYELLQEPILAAPVEYERIPGYTPEAGTVYVCPRGDFTWSQQSVGEQIPKCPTHGIPLEPRDQTKSGESSGGTSSQTHRPWWRRLWS